MRFQQSQYEVEEERKEQLDEEWIFFHFKHQKKHFYNIPKLLWTPLVSYAREVKATINSSDSQQAKNNTLNLFINGKTSMPKAWIDFYLWTT